MPEQAKRFRFTLGSLLLLPLLVSPILLSPMVIHDALNPGESVRGAYSFLNVLALATIYSAIFTGCSRQRHLPQWYQARNVLPAAWKGAGYGALFMAQIALPLLVTLGLRNRRPGGPMPNLGPLVASGGIMLAFGLSVGAFAGILVGLARDASRSKSTEDSPAEVVVSDR